MPAPLRPVLRHLVTRLMERDLRAAFRRVAWVGDTPDLPADVPVLLYANHHNFYDGYLLHLVVDRLLGREGLTWMADWDRFPFFAAAGALPFPADDPARRAATLRRTLRRLRRASPPALVLFPEGRLHRAEEGVLPFDAQALQRLDRLLPHTLWWPVGIYPTWTGAPRPTVLLAGGTPRPGYRGDERERLQALLKTLAATPPASAPALLEGRRGPQERWNFGPARRFFERWL